MIESQALNRKIINEEWNKIHKKLTFFEIIYNVLGCV